MSRSLNHKPALYTNGAVILVFEKCQTLKVLSQMEFQSLMTIGVYLSIMFSIVEL